MPDRKSPQVAILALATFALVPFAAGAFIGHAAAIQAPAESARAADKFTGTWHWMFNGKSFATLTLARNESGYTGSMTGIQIELNDDGSLRSAEPSGEPPTPIKKAWLDGSDLHITAMVDDDEMHWVFTLKDDKRAEIRAVAMANMKPIPLEKAE